MTEQQRYRVLDVIGDAELREYDDCVVADVVVAGPADKAANAAFQPLFRYISGANRSASSIAMTSPVLQQSGPEKLAMTAPVLQEQQSPDNWTVSFVLPGDRSIDYYPTPTDPRVTLRAIPRHTAAALRWSGRWTTGNIDQRTEELRQAIATVGWEEVGEPRWARFNPPWTPPFARHNEIVIPVRRLVTAGPSPTTPS